MSRRLRDIIAVLLGVAMAPLVWGECNETIPLSRPDARYIDHLDGTVTDQVTGLMWRQCPEGVSSTASPCDTGTASSFSWQQALQHADAVNATNGGERQGYADWRLPDLKELMSLVELACHNPAINRRLFPATPPSHFWSATAVASRASEAWSVGFYYGGDRWGDKEGARYVRLVRTPN